MAIVRVFNESKRKHELQTTTIKINITVLLNISNHLKKKKKHDKFK